MTHEHWAINRGIKRLNESNGSDYEASLNGKTKLLKQLQAVFDDMERVNTEHASMDFSDEQSREHYMTELHDRKQKWDDEIENIIRPEREYLENEIRERINILCELIFGWQYCLL